MRAIDLLLILAIVAVVIVTGSSLAGRYFEMEADEVLESGLNTGIPAPTKSHPGVSLPEYRSQPTDYYPTMPYENQRAGGGRRGVIITRGERPPSATDGAIRRDREAWRPPEAYSPQWTLSGDWTKDPIFRDPNSPYYVRGDGMKDSDYQGILWRKETGFTKYPPRGGQR